VYLGDGEGVDAENAVKANPFLYVDSCQEPISPLRRYLECSHTSQHISSADSDFTGQGAAVVPRW
jgi:hypothetical protein